MVKLLTRLGIVATFLAVLLSLGIMIPGGTVLAKNQDKVQIIVKFSPVSSSAARETAVTDNGGTSLRDLPQLRMKVMEVSANAADHVLAAMQKNPNVESAEFATTVSPAGTPNDTSYAQQWALAKIGWDQVYGSVAIPGSATIAVLDSGVDASHPDLAGVMAPGISFTGGNANTDPYGHGTALAGICAASVNNNTGIAGVAYAGVKISSVQVLQADGSGLDSDVIAGVVWATDNGAKVILMGFSSFDYSPALADALKYAWDHGVVLVAATGNNGSTAASYPAGMTNVLGVAATDQNDSIGANSNTGSANVAAPGVSIYTTQTGGGYGSISGTSAAAANVAGLTALLTASGQNNQYIFGQVRGATDKVAGQAFGRINMATALGASVTPPVNPPGPDVTPSAEPPIYVASATGDFSSRQNGNWNDKATWIKLLTGTVTFNIGNTTVVGTGTSFTTELNVGDILMLQGATVATVRGTVANIGDNTHLTLNAGAVGATASGAYGKQAVPSSSDLAIVINNAVTVTADVIADQLVCNTGSSITVNNGATLTIADGIGTDFNETNTTIMVNGVLVVNAGASFTGGGGNGGTTGSLTVGSTGNLNVNGNLTQSSAVPIQIVVNGTASIGGSITFTADSLFTINSGGNVTVSGNVALGSVSNLTISDGGNLTISGTGSVSGIRGNVGNVISVSGTVTLTDSATISALGPGIITVNSGGMIELGPNAKVLGNNFTLASGSIIKVGSTAGITSSGATGNIQTSTRNFDSGASYIYDGTSSQATGNALPTSLLPYTLLTGSAQFTNGNKAVTGVGTQFLTELSIGDVLVLSATPSTIRGTVASIGDNTHLTLVANATNTANGPYMKQAGGLTIDNNAGVTLTGNVTVDGKGTLYLKSGDLTTAAFSVMMTDAATTTGNFDVVGTVKRTNPSAGAKTYGSAFTSLNFGSAVTGDVTVTLIKSLSGFTSYVNRTFTLVKPAGAGSADVRLHYRSPADLVGNPTENNLSLYRKDAGTFVLQGKDSGAISGDASWVQKNGVSTFSDWAIASAGKADATIVVNGYTGTYDGNAHGATGTATGAGGLDLSSLLHLGATFTNVPGGTAHWTFDGNTDYNSASGDVAIVINRADASVNVTGFTGTYDGNPHGASGTATGVGGIDLAASLSLGASFTNVPGGTAHWSFANPNYNPQSGDVNIAISKIDPVISVSGYTGTYDAAAHGATGTAKGAKGETLAGLDLGASFTNVPGGTANWKYTDVTGNYNDKSGTAAIVIGQATPVITWANPADITYGTALGATQLNASASVGGGFVYTPVSGTVLNAGPSQTLHAVFTPTDTTNYTGAAKDVSINVLKATPVITWSNPADINYGTALDSTQLNATTPVAGSFSYTPAAGFVLNAGSNQNLHVDFTPADTANYNTATADVKINVLSETPTLSITNSSVTYNGSPQAAIVTGSVPGTVSNIKYNGSATPPTDAGTYAITADFAPTDTTNYNSLTGASAGDFVIRKAVPTLSVTNSPVTFNGSAWAATVSGTVPGSVANILTGGAATQTDAGTYAVTADFTPTDATNYESLTAAAAGNFVIQQAATTVHVTNSPVVFNGSPQAAVVVSSMPGAVSNVKYGGSATVPTNAATYAVTADFVPTDANYASLTGASAGDFIINKAVPTLSVTNSPVTYNGSLQSAAVSASVPGTVSNILTGGAASQTNAATYAVTADFVPTDANYASLTGASAGDFIINKAVPTLSVTNSPVTYNGSPWAATVSGSVPGSVTNILTGGAATQTDASTYAVTADFVPTDATNYSSLTGATAGDFTIQKVGASGTTFTVTNSPKTYNGAQQAATVVSSVPGTVDNVRYNGSTTVPTNAGTYAITVDFTPDDIYNYETLTDASAGNFVIQKATPTLSVTNTPVTYNGLPQSATVSAGSVPGVLSNILTGGGASQTNAGTYAVKADFAPGDTTNYNVLTGASAGNFVIQKATPTLSVTNSPVTYNGLPQSAAVAGSVPGAVSNVLTGGAASQTNAATYAVTADFAPGDTTNYNALTGASAGNFVIQPATPTLSVGNSPVTFNGLPQAAAVNGSVAGTVSNVKYNGSATVPTNANTYIVTADFVPNDTTNYSSLSGTSAGNFVIQKATPTLSVTNSPKTYNGSAWSAAVAGSVPGSVSNISTGGAITQTNAGTYAVTADFVPADTANYNSLTSAAAGNFVIQKAGTTLTITSSNILPTGGVSVQATLKDGSTPIPGRVVTFTASSASGSGTTDASGTAKATLSLVSGQYNLNAAFAGDDNYQPATATAQTLIVYQPSQFVIWGGNQAKLADAIKVGQNFNFWGSQWSKQVTTGSYDSNAAFKGYAATVTGSSWTTGPGNSSNPPATIGSYISVIVATHIAKNGNNITGDIAEMVIMRVDNTAGYLPDPGHSASGTVVSIINTTKLLGQPLVDGASMAKLAGALPAASVAVARTEFIAKY